NNCASSRARTLLPTPPFSPPMKCAELMRLLSVSPAAESSAPGGLQLWRDRDSAAQCARNQMRRRSVPIARAREQPVSSRRMTPGRASATATLVCMGRAAAHEATSAARFSDPTALALLPEEARERVRRVRAGEVPKDWRGRIRYEHLRRLAQMMVARTVAIDDAVREAKAPQLVILGAGLDGRAWRMPELRDAVVYEVDHPDSQRVKRERAASLTPLARELRFVPVDFTRDRLGDAL